VAALVIALDLLAAATAAHQQAISLPVAVVAHQLLEQTEFRLVAQEMAALAIRCYPHLLVLALALVG